MSNVIHQNYYNKPGKKECWDEIASVLGKSGALDFCLGSALKYGYRIGDKEGNPEEQELEKINVYLDKAPDFASSIFEEDKILLTKIKLKEWGIDIEGNSNAND